MFSKGRRLGAAASLGPRGDGVPFVILVCALLTSACADAARSLEDPEDLVAWTLRGPNVDIGVIDGEPHYELDDVASAVRLEDGRIILADAGTAELRIYDSRGVFLARGGGRGEGPGEFRRPGRIHITHRDSLLIDDPVLRRTSRFDTAGRFVWAETWPRSDEPFPGSAWLYGRHLVDGPRDKEQRGPVRRALEALPGPGPDGYRWVIVDAQWRLWIRDEPHAAGTPAFWRVHDLAGNAVAGVTLPADFEPTHFGPDFIVGVATDSMNVEHVRVYDLDGMPRESQADAKSFADGGPEPSAPAPPSEEALSALRTVLRSATGAQERFYSSPDNGYRYAGTVGQLELDPATLEDVEVHIVSAGPRGYTMLAFHEREAAACALTVGLGGPLGWTSGRALCQ